MGVVVRRLVEADAVAVTVLRERVAAEDQWIGEASSEDREFQVERVVQSLSNSDAARWVADADGEIAGGLLVSHERGLAQLGMFLAPDVRGQGVGSRMLVEAINWAKAAGCHKLVLEVWPNNGPARRLYLRHGFREEGLRRRHVRRRDGALWDIIEMGLVFDDASPSSPHHPWEPT